MLHDRQTIPSYNTQFSSGYFRSLHCLAYSTSRKKKKKGDPVILFWKAFFPSLWLSYVFNCSALKDNVVDQHAKGYGLQPVVFHFTLLKNGPLCFHFEPRLNSYMLSDLQAQIPKRIGSCESTLCVLSSRQYSTEGSILLISLN